MDSDLYLIKLSKTSFTTSEAYRINEDSFSANVAENSFVKFAKDGDYLALAVNMLNAPVALFLIHTPTFSSGPSSFINKAAYFLDTFSSHSLGVFDFYFDSQHDLIVSG